MWNKNILWAACVVLLMMSSCGSRKQVHVPKVPPLEGSEKAVEHTSIKTFELSNLDFHTFSGRAKTSIRMGESAHDVTLHLRMDRDKAIWISVTAMLGIEPLRILITPDSIKMMNKLQGEYTRQPFSYIYRYISRGITFTMLQDLLMANVSSTLLRTDNIQIASADDQVVLAGIKDDLTFQYGVNKFNRPFSFKLKATADSQNMQAQYGDYANFAGYHFPQLINILLHAEQRDIQAVLTFNRVVFNEAIEMPFTIPARYKEMN